MVAEQLLEACSSEDESLGIKGKAGMISRDSVWSVRPKEPSKKLGACWSQQESGYELVP
jgi:hypothetical protein